jgi:hypothetical protein
VRRDEGTLGGCPLSVSYCQTTNARRSTQSVTCPCGTPVQHAPSEGRPTFLAKGLLFEAGQHSLYVGRFSGHGMKGSLQFLSLGAVLRQILNHRLHEVEPLVDRVHVIDEYFSRLLYGVIHLDAHLDYFWPSRAVALKKKGTRRSGLRPPFSNLGRWKSRYRY